LARSDALQVIRVSARCDALSQPPLAGGVAWGWAGVRSIGELARRRTSQELWSDRQIGRHRLTSLPDAVPNAGRGAGASVTCPPSSSLSRESAGFDCPQGSGGRPAFVSCARRHVFQVRKRMSP
jgi:hypothetical protein